MRRRDLIAATFASGIAHAARAAAMPVVLELFTSQGCSSCPPADALLGELAQRPSVIALAWHVDYWDHLGWRDRFASRVATTRQRDYARELGSDVFTPALVINGREVVVGSRRAAVEAAIRSARALPAAITLNRLGGTVGVEVGDVSGPVRLQRIVFDPSQATDVGFGENGGARLREYRIVRSADTLAEWDGAASRFNAAAAPAGQGLAMLVQSADLRILGAADLPPV